MKNNLFIILAILVSMNLFSQAPQAFKYQAVVRDNAGDLLTEQGVNFQIDIRSTAVNGLLVYSESHIATTNSFGLVTLEIGKGATTDDFTAIAWGEDVYFMTLWINGEEMGTVQLISVPYALHAKTAETIVVNGQIKNVTDPIDEQDVATKAYVDRQVTSPGIHVQALIDSIKCFGEINGAIDINVTGGTPPYTYDWDDGSTTEDIENIGAGKYQVYVEDSNGLTAFRRFILLAAEEIEISYDVTVSSGHIDITVKGGSPPYSYLWSNGSTSEDQSGLEEGTYTVQVTDALGCNASQEIVLGDPGIATNSCEGCHTDYERLIAVHSPDTVPPVSGAGGEAPHYEPYDRVFLGGDGYVNFKASAHYSVGCTGCHNGIGDSGDKAEAHSTDWISSPSLIHEEKCAVCHESISDNYMSSLHNGTGQKRKVAMRSSSGHTGSMDFDNLPAHQIEGYDEKCSYCHGTCGNCHVVRPRIAGGGLSSGHNFNKEPSMISVCVSCHSARTGNAFLGVSTGTEPDVHLTESSFTCLDCHSGIELHGDGQAVEQRYEYTELPACEECHVEIASSNTYHSMHYDDFQCQICHSQSYNSCGACHIKDGTTSLAAFLDFKIAKNTIPGIKDYKLALVTRTPAHPENWVGYGADLEYENFEAFPTFNYTTPHNILKQTAQTSVADGASCASSCHIRNEGGTLINSELYLWKSNLETWETVATQDYTVDGVLPASWFVEQ